MNRHTLRALALLLAIGATADGATAQDAPKRNVSGGVIPADQACFDVRHYDLAVRVLPKTRRIEGRLVMRARMTADAEVVALDLDDALRASTVSAAGVPLAFEHARGRIVVRLPRIAKVGEEIAIEVAYAGAPKVARMPPWNGGFTWSETSDGRPWIATSCQGEGADLWWPCKDHPGDEPDGMTIEVTVPKGLFCASNGVLDSRTEGEKETTFRWRVLNPIAPYAVAIAVAPYVELRCDFASVAGVDVPVHFWALPEHEEKAKALLPEILRHLAFFESLLGPYPFRNEKYGVVETPFLGMEHQTCIAYGNRYAGLKQGWDWLHHHELAHEWWGNLLTCRDWKDMWIHEGFGTYMQALYLERLRGAEAYAAEMDRYRTSIANGVAIAPRASTDSSVVGGGSSDVYYKGAWILHGLRWLIGDEAFFRFLRELCHPDPATATGGGPSTSRGIDSEEVIAAAERAAGRPLGWYFEVYLRHAALPELVRTEGEDGRTTLTWKTPDDLPFPMPVPVRNAAGEIQRLAPRDGRIVVPADAVVDPERRLLEKNHVPRRLRDR